MDAAREAAPLLSGARATSGTQRRAALRAAVVAAAALGLLVLSVLLFAAAPPAAAAAADGRAHSVSMLVLGDWGREAQHGQSAVADALARAVLEERNRSENVVVLSTGDNFYKSGVGSVNDRQFNTSFEDVYHHAQLNAVPWLVSLGNHDHLGSIHAQMSYSQLSTRWYLPSPYYSRQLSPNLMGIFLDTTPFVGAHYGHIARQVNAQSPKAQLQWLSETLRALPPHMHFVLVGHHNMYSMSIADHLGTPELRNAVEPLLRRYNHRMVAYVSGHEHSLMHLQPAAQGGAVVDHFVSGAGSKLHIIERPSPAEEAHWSSCCDVLPLRARASRAAPGRTVWGRAAHGFFVLRVDGRSFSARATGADGATLYHYHKSLT